MNKWILFVFASFMIASLAQAATPTGDSSTDTNPLMNTPQRCSCETTADNNVNIGQGSDEKIKGAPMKQRAAEAMGTKGDNSPQNTKTVKDTDAG